MESGFKTRHDSSTGTAALGPIRLPGDKREPGRASGVLLVVGELGRIEDEASFGSTELFLRLPVLGAPEAQFLKDKSPQPSAIINNRGSNMGPRDMAQRLLIASVFRESKDARI